MTDGAQYLLPGGSRPAAVAELLAQRLGAAADAARSTDRTFYDTFDGRLHAAGLTLVQCDGALRLESDGPLAERRAAPERLLVGDLPAGPLRDALAGLVDVRALVPTARVRSRERALRVLDDERKTVVRLRIEAPSLVSGARARHALRPRVHVLGVRGYDGPLRRVRRTLEDDLGLVPAPETLYDEAVVAAGGNPAGVSSKPVIALERGEPAAAAAATVLAHLLATAEANLPGTLADVDTEFLHDFRVAVRRTRSVQRQLKAVFAPAPLAAARRDFRRLQQITGPTRDLDVNLLDFDALASALPDGASADLEPLRGVLAARRESERRRMVRALRAAPTRRALADWGALVGGLATAAAGPDAARPIEEVAGDRILRVYRRMVKMGRAIGDDSPPEALHDLRKKGKELRYLLELFGSLYPAEVTKPLVKALKALQDTLGRFQDHEVQADELRSLSGEMAGVDGGPAALMAMGRLVEHLGAEQVAAREEFAERFAAFAAKRRRGIVEAAFG